MPILLAAPVLQTPDFVAQRDYVKTEAMIPMRDGVRLYTAIYTPKETSEKWPILIERTPYNCEPYGANRFPFVLGPTADFDRRGYIFVQQDVRGRYMSEGTHVFSPPHNPRKRGTDHDESSDTYDTVNWLLKNVTNHNGKVGVWGISQPGFYATNSILSRHPAIVAVSPQAPVTDRFKGDDDHHNGAFFLAQRFSFLNSFGAPRPQPTTNFPPTFRVSFPDAYQFFLEMGPLPNSQKYFQNKNEFWNQSMAHGTYDSYWKPRGMEQHLKGLSGPAVLVVGGWFDAEDLFGALKTYGALAKNSPQIRSHLVMGPWTHGQWAGGGGDRIGDVSFESRTADYYNQKIVFPFFEAHLRGQPTPNLAKATVFETGTNRWQTFPTWPPKFKPQSFYLDSGSRLALTPPTAGQESYVSDPKHPVPYTGTPSGRVRSSFMVEDQAFATARPDVRSFTLPAFARDVAYAGPITADLLVSLDTTDADFVVKVIDVTPAADSKPEYQMLLRAEVMRGKFRDSLERPVPFVPGKPTRVKFELNDIFHTFRKGHRLMVQVQSSWFPLVDLNPQTFTDIYRATPDLFRKANVTLHFGPQGSHVVLPRLSP